jgi:hypothetical protein
MPTSGLHSTAGKLGALFMDDLPEVPQLLQAYGRRVTEIAEMPSVNPKGSRSDGVFANHVGADATTIWAAATSGQAAIAVHLLACMLARMWTAPEATSIWSQLVSERRSILQKRMEFNPTHLSTIAASRLYLSRDQLAEWDASARAWLNTADEAKLVQQKQLMLIIRNVGLPIPSASNFHATVLDAWSKAMTTLNSLINGMPQRVQDGSILLGLSSWHLYPDMSVLGNNITEVPQGDPLVSRGGIITIGVQNTSPSSNKGVHWSLPLAHLRYYGHPVVSTGSISEEKSRVSFDNFLVVVVGGIVRRWGAAGSDISSVMEFLITLADSVRESKEELTYWLEALAHAAELFRQSVGDDRSELSRLFEFGRRRCTSFLAAEHPSIPLFGLANINNILDVLNDDETRLAFLRNFGLSLSLDPDSIVIRYYPSETVPGESSKASHSYAEYATLLCQGRGPVKRSHDGCGRPNANWFHRRWIPALEYTWESASRSPGTTFETSAIRSLDAIVIDAMDMVEDSFGLEDNEEFSDSDISEPATHADNPPKLPGPSELALRRSLKIMETAREPCGFFGSNVLVDITPTRFGLKRSEKIVPINKIKSLFSESFVTVAECVQDLAEIAQGFHDPFLQDGLHGRGIPQETDESLIEYEFLFGNPKSMAVFHRTARMSLVRTNIPAPCIAEVTSALMKKQVCAFRLAKHLGNVVARTLCQSLRGLAIASEIYTLLPDSKVDLGVISKRLYEARWICQSSQSTRARTFSCIAMFETGGDDISPDYIEDVMAISVGNSIYVVEALLCDPSRTPPEYAVRRIIGNIGKAGVAMLVSPKSPKMRELKYDTWNVINHAKFDGRLEDQFSSTSLHLSFTGYELPLRVGDHGGCDREAFLLETVVSIDDRGEWVADLDLLASHDALSRAEFPGAMRVTTKCIHLPAERCNTYFTQQLSTIDSWHEFEDRPVGTAIVRANGNWLARQAATALGIQSQYPIVVVPELVCWRCVQEALDLKSQTDDVVLVC